MKTTPKVESNGYMKLSGSTYNIDKNSMMRLGTGRYNFGRLLLFGKTIYIYIYKYNVYITYIYIYYTYLCYSRSETSTHFFTYPYHPCMVYYFTYIWLVLMAKCFLEVCWGHRLTNDLIPWGIHGTRSAIFTYMENHGKSTKCLGKSCIV